MLFSTGRDGNRNPAQLGPLEKCLSNLTPPGRACSLAGSLSQVSITTAELVELYSALEFENR